MSTRKEYLEQWKAELPRETYWYFVSVSQYRGHTYLHITDHDSRWCIIHNDARWDHNSIGPVEGYLEPLLAILEEKVEEIVKDVEAYNRYVEEHLPKRQRTGRITRKDLNRIVPWQRRVPRNLERAIQVLKECMVNEEIYRRQKEGEKIDNLSACYREPLPDMSIREYTKYFKVAYLAYEDHYIHLCKSDSKELNRRLREREKMEKLSPLTVCGILGRLEEKYGIGVGIGKYRDHQHIYLYGWKKRDEKIQIKDTEFMPVNKAMLAVLRMFAREINI